MNNDLAASAVKVAPSVSVSTAWLAGFHMPDAVMLLTAILTTLQIIHLLLKWWKK